MVYAVNAELWREAQNQVDQSPAVRGIVLVSSVHCVKDL